MIQDGCSRFGVSLPDFLAAREVDVPDGIAEDAPPAVAEVNHGRWVALCPDCGGAEYVWLNYPRFFCIGCRNASIGGRWRRVDVPDDRDRIEAVLALRPDPATRNWLPDERTDDLQAENAAHGIGGA